MTGKEKFAEIASQIVDQGSELTDPVVTDLGPELDGPGLRAAGSREPEPEQEPEIG